MNLDTPSSNDREIFNIFSRHESLRKLRSSFDPLFGHPLWWVSFRLNGNHGTLKKSIEASYDIWMDSRVKDFRFSSALYKSLKKKSKETYPFLLEAPKNTFHYCVPLMMGDRNIGYFGLTGLKKGIRRDLLSLASNSVHLILENCLKAEEVSRLSATIRPRAVALSTVHTVHRIINSTLNLEELVSRLAHLTAQVLRANRCAIYLVQNALNQKKELYFNGKPRSGKEKRSLLCKALVGYPKGRDKNIRICFGEGLEGQVAKTAQIVLRKKFICSPLIDEDVVGVMTISSKKDKKEFTYFDQEILSTLAEEAVIAIKNAQLYEEQKRVTLSTIQSLALILGTQIRSVSSPEIFLDLALKVAEELRLNDEEKQALHYATLLKDTAKIGIPEEILRKPSKLTGEEYQLLREHPIKGAKIVQSFESLKSVVPIILYSREKFDGTGYPEGLKGEGIPIGARILSVINAFEAIIMGRPYRDRSSIHEAFDEILRNSGTQFDPRVVDAFVRVVRKERFEKFLQKSLRQQPS